MLSTFQSAVSVPLIAGLAAGAQFSARMGPAADRLVASIAPTANPPPSIAHLLPAASNASADDENGTNSTPPCPLIEALDPEAFLPRSLPLAQLVPLTAIYAIIFVTGVLGNSVTLAVLLANRHMRTATNAYLANLAIADLVFLLSGLPLEVHDFYVLYPFPFPEWVCQARAVLTETLTNASVLTLMAFTIERYLAICHPLLLPGSLDHALHADNSALVRAVRVVAVSWAVAIVCALHIVPQTGLTPIELGFMAEDVGGVPAAAANGSNALDNCTFPSMDFFLERFSGTEICSMDEKNAWVPVWVLSFYIFFYIPLVLIIVLYILIWKAIRDAIGGPHSRAPAAASAPDSALGEESRSANASTRHHWADTARNPASVNLMSASMRSPRDLLNTNVSLLAAGGAVAESLDRQRSQLNARARKSVVRMLFAVAGCFFLCWAPFQSDRIATTLMAIRFVQQQPQVTAEDGDLGQRESLDLKSHLFRVTGVLVYVSATINPILYVFLSTKFRRALRMTFPKLVHCLLLVRYGKRGRSSPLHDVLQLHTPTRKAPRFGAHRNPRAVWALPVANNNYDNHINNKQQQQQKRKQTPRPAIQVQYSKQIVTAQKLKASGIKLTFGDRREAQAASEVVGPSWSGGRLEEVERRPISLVTDASNVLEVKQVCPCCKKSSNLLIVYKKNGVCRALPESRPEALALPKLTNRASPNAASANRPRRDSLESIRTASRSQSSSAGAAVDCGGLRIHCPSIRSLAKRSRRTLHVRGTPKPQQRDCISLGESELRMYRQRARHVNECEGEGDSQSTQAADCRFLSVAAAAAGGEEISDARPCLSAKF